MDPRRASLLADIELTRQQVSRAVSDSKHRVVLLGALLSTAAASVWLYRALRRTALRPRSR